MTRNVRWAGRVARILVAVLVLGLYGALLPPWKYLTLIGLIPLASGLTGFDPFIAWLGARRRGRADAR